MLVNGMLTNCEVWYNLIQNQVEVLEGIDLMLLRKSPECTQQDIQRGIFLGLPHWAILLAPPKRSEVGGAVLNFYRAFRAHILTGSVFADQN